MLATDGFTPFPGEMERMRSCGRLYEGNSGKSGQADAETVRNGDSFPEMLESIQNGAMDKADEEGKTSRVKPDGETVDVEERAALETLETEEKTAVKEGVDPGVEEEKPQVYPEYTGIPVFAEKNSVPADGAGKARRGNPEHSGDGGELLSSLTGDKDTLEKTGDAPGSGLPLVDGENADREIPVRKNSSPSAEIPVPDSPQWSDSGERLSVTREEQAEGRKEAVFSVIDLRRKAAEGAEAEVRVPLTADSAGTDVEMHMFVSQEFSSDDPSSFQDSGRSLDSRGDGFSFRTSSMFRSGAESAGNGGNSVYGSFAEKLSAEIRANASEFVRAGQIVLRNGSEGMIRLTLHPETLGPVRISLEMSGDKKLSGKIMVSSQEAWDAFEGSMDSLVRSFNGEGFDTAGFDLSWAGGGAGSEERNMEGKISSPFYASSIPDVMPGGISSDNKMARDGARVRGSWYAVDVFA